MHRLQPQPQKWLSRALQRHEHQALKIKHDAQTGNCMVLGCPPQPVLTIPAQRPHRGSTPRNGSPYTRQQDHESLPPHSPRREFSVRGPCQWEQAQQCQRHASNQHGGMPTRTAYQETNRRRPVHRPLGKWRKSNALEHQRAVSPTKAEVVLHGYVDLHVPCSVGTVVQITLEVLVEDVDGGRTLLVVKSQHGEH